MEQMFSKHADSLPKDFSPFNPFPKAQDRFFWQGLDPELKSYLLGQAQSALSSVQKNGWPQINASHYLNFYRTGNRIQFEDLYFNRRALLSCLVLGECIENKGTYLDAITDGIFLLCQESGWQLPPHNNGLPLPDRFNPIIDLFAGETACQLAMTNYLLGKELDAVSPLIASRICEELEERIFGPYTNEHFWWMYEENKPACNWTPWITQNVLAATFLCCTDEEEKSLIVKKALKSLDYFADSYGDDGCCNEGPEYYRHAALCLCNAIDVLNATSGNLFAQAAADTKIRNMAEYIMNMNVPGTDYYINFADASPRAGKAGAREYHAAKLTDSKALLTFAVAQWKSSSTQEKLLGLCADSKIGNNLYYLMQTLTLSSELGKADDSESTAAGDLAEECPVSKAAAPQMLAEESPVNKTTSPTSIFYKSTGVYIFKNKTFTLAVKGGCNADSHNHNDTGSITLYKKGRPFLIDVGVESYSAKTFSDQRYTIWTMQSAYHNLPTVNGAMQKDGPEYKAQNVELSKSSVSMDIAKAYPKEASLESYKRNCSLDGGKVTVLDSYQSSRPDAQVVLSLMFSQKPELSRTNGSESQGLQEVIKAGDLGTIQLFSKAPVKTSIQEISISDPRLRRAWPEKIYRVLVEYKDSLALQIE